MAKTNYKDIDAYIDAQPEALRPVLETVRAAIRRAIPEGVEAISYQMPAFKVGGRVAIFFAGWKQHWSLYPVMDHHLVGLEGGFEKSKGTLKFPLSGPVPEALVEHLAKAMAAETLERVAAAKKKPK